MTSDALPLSVAGPDYPTELLLSAAYLWKKAAEQRAKHPPDERKIPHPHERALARAAVFTACNALECLLMDLVQEHLGRVVTKTKLHTDIEQKIKNRQANVSWTMKEWTKALAGTDVTQDVAYANFQAILLLRNELAHPKLDTYGNPTQRTQDDLLKVVDEARARWVVAEVSTMAAVLYQTFGKQAPVSIKNPFA